MLNFIRSPRVLGFLQRVRILNQRRKQSTKVIEYKQDLPPKEGYEPFDWHRIPQKQGLYPSTIFMWMTASTAVAFCLLEDAREKYRTELLEILDAKLAIEPLLQAERDRLLLKRTRMNRDEEEELMKNVPGWEVGKWYHEPIYKTVPENHWIQPKDYDLWAHSDPYKYQIWLHWYYIG